jgi:hypothetical protein
MARASSRVMALAIGVSFVVLSFTPAFAEDPPAEEPVPVPVPVVDDSVGVVDPAQGFWWLRDADTGSTTSFYFGNPGDIPFAGDWDCDGIDTPGLYRQVDGYVYLRNSNTQGNANVSYFFGNPGDVPLAGDFNDDDLDTFGMFDESTGRVYLNNRLAGGGPDQSFFFGDRSDIAVTGAWAGGADAVGVYRTPIAQFYLPETSPPGAVVDSFRYGGRGYIPISGAWGSLPGGNAAPTSKPYLVSEFTTYHPSGQARNTNIDLIADMVDGAVVMPGEVFSLNDHVGQRTEAKGFVRAGAIIGGEVYCCDHPVNIGGGTSQFTTTMYNAIFFGAYEDVYHRAHSLYFSRYPVVREATLGWTSPDLKFRNDTIFPLTIRTSHTSRSVTVQMWGDNQGRSVSTWTVGSVSSREGGRATVYRAIIYPNGTTNTQSWTHTYRAADD